jgi:hypothetical protein
MGFQILIQIQVTSTWSLSYEGLSSKIGPSTTLIRLIFSRVVDSHSESKLKLFQSKWQVVITGNLKKVPDSGSLQTIHNFEV